MRLSSVLLNKALTYATGLSIEICNCTVDITKSTYFKDNTVSNCLAETTSTIFHSGK